MTVISASGVAPPSRTRELSDADRLEVLVEPLSRMDSRSPVPDLLALVLGRFPDA